jgi:hypothetical protein
MFLYLIIIIIMNVKILKILILIKKVIIVKMFFGIILFLKLLNLMCLTSKKYMYIQIIARMMVFIMRKIIISYSAKIFIKKIVDISLF